MDEIALARRIDQVAESGPGVYGWADMTAQEANVATEALRRRGIDDATVVALCPDGAATYFHLAPGPLAPKANT